MTTERVSTPGRRVHDLTGKVFHELTVIRIGPKDSGGATWFCKCRCGTETLVSARYLKNGHTKSCGCYRTKTTSERSLTHGESRRGNGRDRTPEYKTWCSMIARCHNSNSTGYPKYGGRGITVCERWRASYEAFLEDMGRKPSKKHSIERINNEEGYSPDNCRWATTTEQNRNTRNNVAITFQGQNKVMSEWAREYGIKPGTLWKRLKLGWSIERSLNQPLRPKFWAGFAKKEREES